MIVVQGAVKVLVVTARVHESAFLLIVRTLVVVVVIVDGVTVTTETEVAAGLVTVV